jgi:hypothetical protein
MVPAWVNRAGEDWGNVLADVLTNLGKVHLQCKILRACAFQCRYIPHIRLRKGTQQTYNCAQAPSRRLTAHRHPADV